MSRLSIEDINGTLRVVDGTRPICAMLGTHRQAGLAAREIVSAVNYKRDGKAARDERRLAQEQAERWGSKLPRHLDLGGGVHILTIGKPREGQLFLNTCDPRDNMNLREYFGLPSLSRSEALEWVPYLNMPEIVRDAYRRLINGEHLTADGKEVRHA